MLNTSRDRGIESLEVDREIFVHLFAMFVAFVFAWRWFVASTEHRNEALLVEWNAFTWRCRSRGRVKDFPQF